MMVLSSWMCGHVVVVVMFLGCGLGNLKKELSDLHIRSHFCSSQLVLTDQIPLPDPSVALRFLLGEEGTKYTEGLAATNG